MPSDVWFCPLDESNTSDVLAAKTAALFDTAGLGACFKQDALVAVKMHFGEGDNTNVVAPRVIGTLVGKIAEAGAKPFLTDSNTLYRGTRSNAVDHLNTAYRHGYTPEAMGCPVIISDGMTGSDRAVVPIKGKHFERISLASVTYFADAALVVSHATGHCLAGYGGAIKSVAMGMASRAGKLAQHHNTHPIFDAAKCTACGQCARWCPADAIEIGEHANLLAHKCIGCGECYTVCPAGAIGFQWSEVSSNVQEKMAEHVRGYQAGRRPMVYLNYAVFLTRDCDCGGTPQARAFRDVGIFASYDPVAADAATIDTVNRLAGRDLFKEFWPKLDYTLQLAACEELGAGTRDYRLVQCP